MGDTAGDRRRWTPIFDRIPEDKRLRVLYSAKREFAEKGFAGANVNAIAASAGISVGALYKYFRSKEDIFLAIIEASRELIESTIDGILAERLGFLSRVEAILRSAVDSSRADPEMVRIYIACTTRELSPLADHLAGRIEGATATRYRAMVAEAKAHGEIDSSMDEGLAAFLLDDVFLALQFAYGSEYYRERLRIFAGEAMRDIDASGEMTLGAGRVGSEGTGGVVEAALEFIARALGARKDILAGDENLADKKFSSPH